MSYHPYTEDQHRAAFAAKIVVEDEPNEVCGTPCHIWTAAKRPNGYGAATFLGKNTSAHAAAWLYAGNELPADRRRFHLRHRCMRKLCVNVDHLEVSTAKRNHADPDAVAAHRRSGETIRRIRAEQTHCKRGHPLSGENLYQHGPRRHCKACRAMRRKRAQA